MLHSDQIAMQMQHDAGFNFAAMDAVLQFHGAEKIILLHLHPGLIAMEHAANFAPISIEIEKAGGMLTPEGAVGFGWQTQDLEPSGACGDAAAADADRGSMVVQRAAKALVQLCREVHAYPMDRVTQKTLYNTSRQGVVGNRS